MQQALDLSHDIQDLDAVVSRVANFPRLRYMGSKFRLIPQLVAILAELEFESALDAFSGSGVVSYAMKAMGKSVTSNDFLNFAATVARSTVENQSTILTSNDVQQILSPSLDGRDFIHQTFKGLYFPDEDHQFLDSAWSHIDCMPSYKRDLAISALCLAAARKQPRGVFTVTDFRYDDGRRSLRAPLAELFQEAVADYNGVVFPGSVECRALVGDVFESPRVNFDLVYLDPPYAPRRDDNCYIKRYHFLEGLSVYWRGQEIMQETTTKKLVKRYTPFSYRKTVEAALAQLFERFNQSVIVLSYSSNAYPSVERLQELLLQFKNKVIVHSVDHRYSFGTHAAAKRRRVNEYILVAT